MSQTIDVSGAAAPVKRSRRWQFSIKSILVLMSACCALLACCAFPPLGIIAMMVFGLCLLVYCVIAIFYGRGWIRPFGMACGSSILLSFFLLMASNPPGPGAVAIVMFVATLVSVVIGFVAAAAHGYLVRRVGIVPIPDVPFLKDWLYNPEPRPFEVK